MASRGSGISSFRMTLRILTLDSRRVSTAWVGNVPERATERESPQNPPLSWVRMFRSTRRSRAAATISSAWRVFRSIQN